MRIVGLDVGERRIGVAISDATGTLARPIGVLQSTRLDAAALRRAVDEVRRLAAEEDGVATVVVGLPCRLDGTPTGLTPRVQQFARDLALSTQLPIVLQDERLTSHEAEALLSRREKDWRKRKLQLDAVAAAVILQDYLDSRPRRILDSEP